MEETQETDWFKSVIDDWNTGGKNHYIWEGIENVGKSVLRTSAETTAQPTEQKELKKDYIEERNAIDQDKQTSSLAAYATKENLMYAGLGLAAFIILKKVV